MPSIALSCHPSTPGEAIFGLEVRPHVSGKTLSLRYTLAGDIDALRFPAPGPPQRADGLWQDTCFEAFLKAQEPLAGYYEFNFSPSGTWAIYRFDAYRVGMEAVSATEPPAISLRHNAGRFELDALITLDGLPMLAETTDIRLALSAVLKDKLGRVSYWACAHPPGKPDFHHPDSFVCTLGQR